MEPNSIAGRTTGRINLVPGIKKGMEGVAYKPINISNYSTHLLVVVKRVTEPCKWPTKGKHCAKMHLAHYPFKLRICSGQYHIPEEHNPATKTRRKFKN